jgi:hypothetical protein
MQRRTRVGGIALLVLGLILGCCWLPRGLTGLVWMVRAVSPAVRLPLIVDQILRFWADPLAWYGQWWITNPGWLGPRVSLILVAVPNCLCGAVAIGIIAMVIFLFLPTRGARQADNA